MSRGILREADRALVVSPPRSVVAVIVTYRPDNARVEQVLRALNGDVRGVVIVDNGSEGLDEDRWRLAFPTLDLRRLGTNRGVAAAQNEGVAAARELGASHVLLLDQDSMPEPGMVPALCAAMESLVERKKKVACVGPRLRARGSSEADGFTRTSWLTFARVVYPSAGEAAIECEFMIASGSLIPVSAWEDVGGMEEGLFIDQVDTEWCLRARAMGYGIYGAGAAVLEHSIADAVQRVWLGRWRCIARHEPFRYYYIFRNTLSLVRRRYVPLKVALYLLKWISGLFIAFGLFGGGSGELRMMLRGARDALRGVTGKLNDGPDAAARPRP